MSTKKKLTASKDFKEMSIKEFVTYYLGNDVNKDLWQQLLNNINNADVPVETFKSQIPRTRKDGSVTWNTAVYAGYKHGKRIYRWVSADTPEESKNKAIVLKKQIELGNTPKSKKEQTVTVGDYLVKWLKLHKQTVTDRTNEAYRAILSTYVLKRSAVNSNLPQISHIRIDMISSNDLQKLYDAMNKSDRIAPTTIRSLHSMLRMPFNQAVVDGVMPKDIMRGTTRPRVARKSKISVGFDEARRLVEASKNHQLGSLFLMLIGGGFRLGEIRALTWKDVDLESGNITINKSLRWVNNLGYVTDSTKTYRSNRLVELSDSGFAIEGLKKRRADIVRMRLLAGVGAKTPMHNELIFSDDGAKPWGQERLKKARYAILGMAGVDALSFNDFNKALELDPSREDNLRGWINGVKAELSK